MKLYFFLANLSYLCQKMCITACFVSLLLCFVNAALASQFESEDVVPVRINGRISGRFWKRSEENPIFTLRAFGRDLTLNLIPDSSFLSPSFTIQRVRARDVGALRSASGAHAGLRSDFRASINRTEESEGHLQSCFFSGNVDQDENSLVAISLCTGIFGSFITEGNEYLIEPRLRGSQGPDSAEQLHVIRRRILAEFRGVPLLFDGSVETRGAESFTRGGNDARGEARRRRFVSEPRFIETLAVADSSMTHFYGDEIKHYVLTLMSMAAQLYKHPSIKNSVNIVVVKMLVVEDEEVGPKISSNGGVALRNFCSWQQLFNPPSQRHPEHYDTAMLFTREDICGQKSCDTLGVADVGTMCDPKRSCSVIEDNGLQASFTAAHELGHVLSMPHDDSKTCEKLFGDLGGHYLMAPLFVSLNKSAPWSPCSALYITEFFDNGHGDCLLDVPESPIPLPGELPGTLYSLDQQCQQIFGEEFVHCPNMSDSDICSQLWCREDSTTQCSTKTGSLTWADGTPCRSNGTCQHGVCKTTEEVMQPQMVVDGSWGSWGPWQQCSRTCGGGVEFSYRECIDPVPQNGGKYCEGQRVRYQSCNREPCDTSEGKSFREEQCEKYNSPNYLDHNGNMKQWIPKYAGVSPRDRCKLFCRARGSSEFKVFESKVIDGTTCGPDTTSVCVQGQCVKAGCDQVIGSNKRVDKCGECGGNGLSCRKITGSYNKATYGYSDIVTIPVGATNIDIKQRSHRGIKHDGNYLAVKRESGAYILNGNFSVSTVEQDIPVLGAVLKYSGSSTTLERIQSFSQLKEAITIQILATGVDNNPPKIKYTFFIPKDVTFNKSKEKKGLYLSLHVISDAPDWVSGEWSECSKSCGSGWSRRSIECRDSDGFVSSQCDKELKPTDIRPCGDLPCPIWQMGPWSACSRTCGQGERRRSVFCIDYTGKTVEPDMCDLNKIPEPVSGECNNNDCL
ncbi:A disintegrin and metalloproteinase with thrombospondin motifs 8-like isoform X2 [Girardinichthys multiradiatus]|uniref:A disintegrin and metalloproteinase with thrombospondin motifs 8-like isoform X2 n=1 Tax=Girardinichthys multiradiatus TaxID=208333 RepID=UPI001FACC36F|nr:A disintegrin and metalloproteinase with thrombospondin motifs 8-like isoform X2 [Girardinichthys multiradiatus]